MRSGDHVTYVDAAGLALPATVYAVSGTGVSCYKILALSVDGRGLQTDVPHEQDREDRGHCWRFTPPPSPDLPPLAIAEDAPLPARVSWDEDDPQEIDPR